MPTFISRLLDLVLRRQREDRLSEEIQAHLDLMADDLVAHGMSPADARLAARKAFGGVDQVKERYRDQRGLPIIDALTQDARYSIRMLGKERALTITAIMALGIGIGASNVSFTMVNALLLRDLPVPGGHEIVGLRHFDLQRSQTVGASWLEYQDWQSELKSFAQLTAYRSATVTIGDQGLAPDQISLTHVSANTLGTLRVAPERGRAFRPEEDAAGAAPVVILSYALWQRRYGGDPSVVGRSVRLGTAFATVIGVMPQGFGYPGATDAWQTLALGPAVLNQPRSTRNLGVVGRLSPGSTIATAQTELDAVEARHAQQHPDSHRQLQTTVVRYAEFNNGGWWRVLPPQLLVTGLVLLIACANTANLLLARAAGRSREIALRVSLGATRLRIVRQLMIESLVLAMAAGLVGYVVSLAGVAFVDFTMAEVSRPTWVVFSMDARVIGFLAALCVTTPVLFGLVPALYLSRTKAIELLKEGGRGGTPRRLQRWTSGLVVAEIALSLVVLACAGILIRTMLSLRDADRVVDLEHMMSARFTLPPAYGNDDVRLAFVTRYTERLQGRPAIAASAVASTAPFSGVPPRHKLVLPNQPIGDPLLAPDLSIVSISPRYFEAMGVTLVRGRVFEAADKAPGSAVAIVNQRFAEIYFPQADPIGQQIRLVETAAPDRALPWLTIVGVSPSIRQTIVTEAIPIAYLPYRGETSPYLAIVARSPADVRALAPVLREELRALDAGIPLVSPQTAAQVLSARLFTHYIASGIFIALGLVALLVTTAGLYVITAHAVTARTGEIGVRMAVGAPAISISWLIGRRTLLLVILGSITGVASALASLDLMTIFVAEAGTNDWRFVVGVAAFLAVIGLAAALVPARRAARLDPMTALRHE